ncbi:MFS transporter [Pseudolabrys sp. FHR47]|uniref:AmpG family muropeptide MFS transporter n=1 Tax=Pseudolabrys sp. FHR47 TaxID=2562284 RepID=UPI0010BEC0D3|nr:MFS transporter [Pseudolabrys sp. FHR47]
MTATPEADAATRRSFAEALAVYLKPRVLIVLLLGFSSGLPLALSGSTLAVWLTESHIDLATIGLFSLVGLPYTFKFLWAPLIDALDIPVLSRLLGRRRGWLMFTQLLLFVTIVILGFCDPLKSLPLIIVGAVLVATASATQDIVVDAFRVESLDTSEQGAGMAGYVAAYRIGMLASGAGVLFLVAWLEYKGVPRANVWMWGYIGAAFGMAIGIGATLFATEPDAPATAVDRSHNPLQRLYETATGAFGEFLARDAAIIVLLFVVLYKFCDAFAGALTAAFVIDIGFDKATYAAVVKGVGLAAALIGGFAGGAIVRALPLATSLWIGGIVQMASNLTFSWLALVGVSVPALTVTIIVENFTGAIGTVIFVAYLSALCGDRAHTATQYALLTALAAVGRTTLASGGGFIAEYSGWVTFFIITAVAAIPSLALLWWLQTRGHFAALDKPKGPLPTDN